MPSPDAYTRFSTAAELLAHLPPRRSVAVDGQAVTYRATGEPSGAGRPVVFLHGLLGSADSWALQLVGLAGRHRVVAWDAPGYGGSAGAEPDLDAFADRLRGFLAALALDRPLVVGHSMGGAVAARVAADGDAAGVDRLVLSCTHPGYAAPPGTPPTAKLQDRIRTLKDQGAEAYGRGRAAAMVAQPAAPLALDLAARVAAGTRVDGLFAATRMLQFADLRPLYGRIAAPTRVLFGERDPVVAPGLSAELRDLTPFAEHVILPGVGHAPYLEDPAGYAAALAPFLEAPF
ncbi:MAG: alpha/beta hydrolase [Rhodobacterales bacterium]|nr:alpha/beta hydrolase [Rhodobacterales bacterium]